VILYGLVLDVSDFVKYHPGGTFALEHTIGTDISKYFYGGYALEGNLSKNRSAVAWKHSNYARLIVNDIVIGQFDSDLNGGDSTACFLRD
jgi:cytochrome b involved in lipid metabolism